MNENNNTSNGAPRYDVVVIGGGAAGLSGALVLARSRRTVLVIDAGEPRNAPADGVHNFLSRDGGSPAELLELGRAEVLGYGGEITEGRVTLAAGRSDSFEVELEDGRTVAARRLLVTTGLVDELPDVSGVGERWGRDVIHCAYCHGWEVRDRAVGVLGGSPMAVHQALLFRQLTDDVVFFRHTGEGLTQEQVDEMEAMGIRVVDGRVEGVEATRDRLSGVRLEDGTLVARQALVVGTRMVARSALLRSLGLPVTTNSMGEFIAGDLTGQTAVPGVWVAGNVRDLSATVIAAAAAGTLAGAAINADMVAEDARRAVAARAAATSADGIRVAAT